MLLLTIMFHDTTKCLSLWQCFTGYMCICILNCTVEPCRRGGGLNPHFIFRYCGTIKDLMLKKKRSLCSQNGLLSLVDRSVGLGVFLPLIPYCKRSWSFSSLYLHQNVALTFFVLLRCIFLFFFFFFFVRGPVLSTTDPAFYLSYLTFILSGIWSLLSLV